MPKENLSRQVALMEALVKCMKEEIEKIEKEGEE
jgi:hypothetical protein